MRLIACAVVVCYLPAPAAAVDVLAPHGAHLVGPIAVAASAESSFPPALPVVFSADPPVAFRREIASPGVFLIMRDLKSKDDSMGRPLAAFHHATALRQAMRALKDSSTFNDIDSGEIAVTGVVMGSERAVRERTLRVFEEFGVRPARVRVLSIPRGREAGAAASLWDRARYFLPSAIRDYQKPLRDEVVSGLITTAILEAPNAVYLFAALPSPDAQIVLAVHAVLLTAYTVFQRSVANWILRSRGPALFVKSALAAMPFVVNYSVFGHFSDIRSFWQTQGGHAVCDRIPAELARFALTQGMSVFLQTAFYSRVVNKGLRGWASLRLSPDDAAAARSWVNWLLVPWLWLDSVFLTQAGTQSTVIFRLGDFAFTGGHLGLLALIAAGAWFVSRTALLDATLSWYRRLRR